MIKAIIFDLDGVLVDAVPWHYQALNQALALFGYPIAQEEHTALYNGLPTALKLKLLTQRKGFPESLHPFVNELKQRYTRDVIEKSLSRDEKCLQMIERLKAEGYRVAVASNCVRETVQLMLSKIGVLDFLDGVLSNEDVRNPKPDPEIYQKCFELLGVNPTEAVIVEDSIPGIQAARQACPNVLIVTGPSEVNYKFIKESIRRFDERRQRALTEPATVSDDRTVEILIPMAGNGERFLRAGYKNPKPFIDVLGKPMIQWVIENVKPRCFPAHFTFLCRKAHLEQYPIEQWLKRLQPNCSVVSIPETTQGAACTALLAREFINNQRPLLVANSDQWVEVAIDGFLRKAHELQTDGLIMTFEASESKWSFARVDAHSQVLEVAEKKPISPHATTGIYYFRRGQDFVQGAQAMIRAGKRVNNEYYVCPIYNELLREGKKIHIYPVETDQMHGLGTPEDLEAFLGRFSWKQLSASFPHQPSIRV